MPWVEIASAFVPGQPKTKGSARAFVVDGKARITNDSRDAKPWEQAIAWALRARRAGGEPTLEPVRLELTFYLDRPKGHYGAKGIRPSAPPFPASKPDIDKMLRVALDAGTGVLYRDDAQVVGLGVWKLYPPHSGITRGVEFKAFRWDPDQPKGATP